MTSGVSGAWSAWLPCEALSRWKPAMSLENPDGPLCACVINRHEIRRVPASQQACDLCPGIQGRERSQLKNSLELL